MDVYTSQTRKLFVSGLNAVLGSQTMLPIPHSLTSLNSDSDSVAERGVKKGNVRREEGQRTFERQR